MIFHAGSKLRNRKVEKLNPLGTSPLWFPGSSRSSQLGSGLTHFLTWHKNESHFTTKIYLKCLEDIKASDKMLGSHACTFALINFQSDCLAWTVYACKMREKMCCSDVKPHVAFFHQAAYSQLVPVIVWLKQT